MAILCYRRFCFVMVFCSAVAFGFAVTLMAHRNCLPFTEADPHIFCVRATSDF